MKEHKRIILLRCTGYTVIGRIIGCSLKNGITVVEEDNPDVIVFCLQPVANAPEDRKEFHQTLVDYMEECLIQDKPFDEVEALSRCTRESYDVVESKMLVRLLLNKTNNADQTTLHARCGYKQSN